MSKMRLCESPYSDIMRSGQKCRSISVIQKYKIQRKKRKNKLLLLWTTITFQILSIKPLILPFWALKLKIILLSFSVYLPHFHRTEMRYSVLTVEMSCHPVWHKRYYFVVHSRSFQSLVLSLFSCKTSPPSSIYSLSLFLSHAVWLFHAHTYPANGLR